MLQFKKSLYNIFFEENGNTFLYNSLRRSYAEIPREDYNFFNSLDNLFISKDLTTFNENLFEGLKKGGFIIEEDFNEKNYLKSKIKIVQCQSNTLSLTIAPTLGCNFRCSYCYEKLENKTFSEDEINQTIEFTKLNLVGKKKLDITWYGGEPLLAIDIISKISKELISYCDSKNISYKAKIITNGFLLNEDNVSLMLKYRINSAQVTIDGPEEIHNKTRKLATGKGTFNRIIENVTKNQDLIKIVIRVNVSNINIHYLEQLLVELKQRELHKKVYIYFSIVTAYTDESLRFETSCLRCSDFSTEKIKIDKIAYEHGFKVDFFPEKRGVCGAVSLNSFVLAGDGFIYKCWNSVGVPEQAIGALNNLNKFNHHHYNWLAYTPFDDEECSECNLLPICMGNCPYYKVINGKKGLCSEYKYNLIETLKMHKLYK